MRNVVLSSIVFMLALFFSNSAMGQCVQCLPGLINPNVFTCQSATLGGKECATQGTTCAVSGTCIPNPDRQNDTANTGSKSCTLDSIGSVAITPEIISQIAEKHPRFALALAYLSSTGLLGQKQAEIGMMPIKMSPETYEKWLAAIRYQPSLEEAVAGALFSDRLRDVLPAPDKGADTISYSVTIVESDSGFAMIRLNVVQNYVGDPPFRSITLRAEPTGSVGGIDRWQVKSWEIL